MAVGEDRCSTGSVGVQYAFDHEWNQKNAAQLQYQLQQYLLRTAQAMYVPSLVWKEDSVSSGPGEWIRQKALAWIPVVSMWKIMQSMDRLLKMRRRSQKYWKVRRMTKMQSMKMEN